jgi:hypothetical protein
MATEMDVDITYNDIILHEKVISWLKCHLISGDPLHDYSKSCASRWKKLKNLKSLINTRVGVDNTPLKRSASSINMETPSKRVALNSPTETPLKPVIQPVLARTPINTTPGSISATTEEKKPISNEESTKIPTNEVDNNNEEYEENKEAYANYISDFVDSIYSELIFRLYDISMQSEYKRLSLLDKLELLKSYQINTEVTNITDYEETDEVDITNNIITPIIIRVVDKIITSNNIKEATEISEISNILNDESFMEITTTAIEEYLKPSSESPTLSETLPPSPLPPSISSETLPPSPPPSPTSSETLLLLPPPPSVKLKPFHINKQLSKLFSIYVARIGKWVSDILKTSAASSASTASATDQIQELYGLYQPQIDIFEKIIGNTTSKKVGDIDKYLLDNFAKINKLTLHKKLQSIKDTYVLINNSAPINSKLKSHELCPYASVIDAMPTCNTPGDKSQSQDMRFSINSDNGALFYKGSLIKDKISDTVSLKFEINIANGITISKKIDNIELNKPHNLRAHVVLSNTLLIMLKKYTEQTTSIDTETFLDELYKESTTKSGLIDEIFGELLVKECGDFFQEIFALLHKEYTIYVANDRPSAVRYMVMLLNATNILDGQSVGGYYSRTAGNRLFVQRMLNTIIINDDDDDDNLNNPNTKLVFGGYRKSIRRYSRRTRQTKKTSNTRRHRRHGRNRYGHKTRKNNRRK